MSKRGANASDLRKYKLRLSPSAVRHSSLLAPFKNQANQPSPVSEIVCLINGRRQDSSNKQSSSKETSSSQRPAAKDDRSRGDQKPNHHHSSSNNSKQQQQRSSSCERLARDIRDKITRQLLSYNKSRDSIGSKDENSSSRRPPAAKDSNPIRVHRNNSEIGGGGGSGSGVGGGDRGGGTGGGAEAVGAALQGEVAGILKGAGERTVRRCPTPCTFVCVTGKKGASKVTLQVPLPLGSTEGSTYSVEMAGGRRSPGGSDSTKKARSSTKGRKQKEHKEKGGSRAAERRHGTTAANAAAAAGEHQKRHHHHHHHGGDRGGGADAGESRRCLVVPPPIVTEAATTAAASSSSSYVCPPQQLQMAPSVLKGHPAFITYPCPSSRHKHSTRYVTSQHKFLGANRPRRRLSRSQIHLPTTQVPSLSDNDQGLMLLVLPQGRAGKNEKSERIKRKKVEFAKSDRTSAAGAIVCSPSEMLPERAPRKHRTPLHSFLVVPPPCNTPLSLLSPASTADVLPPRRCFSATDSDEATTEGSSERARFTLWSLSKRLAAAAATAVSDDHLRAKSSSSMPSVASPQTPPTPNLPFPSTPSVVTSDVAASSPAASSTSVPADDKEESVPTVVPAKGSDHQATPPGDASKATNRDLSVKGIGSHFDNYDKMDACVSAHVASSCCSSASAIRVRVTNGQQHNNSPTRAKKTDTASEDQQVKPTCPPPMRRSPSGGGASKPREHNATPPPSRGKSSHVGARGDTTPGDAQETRHVSACGPSTRPSHKPRNKYTVSKGITACLSSPSVSDGAECEAHRAPPAPRRGASPSEGGGGGSAAGSQQASLLKTRDSCTKAVTAALSARSRSDEACSVHPDVVGFEAVLRRGGGGVGVTSTASSSKRRSTAGGGSGGGGGGKEQAAATAAVLASSHCISEGDVSIPVRHSSDGSTGYRRSFRELRPLRAVTNGTSGYSTSNSHRLAATHTLSSESFLAASLIVNAPSCRRPSQSIDLSVSRHTALVRVSSVSSVHTEKSPCENAYVPSPPSSRDDESKTGRTDASKTQAFTTSDPIPQSAWVESKEKIRPSSWPFPKPSTVVGCFSPRTTYIRKPNMLQKGSSTDSKLTPATSQNVSKGFTESQTNALGLTINSQTTSLPSTMLSGFSSNSFADHSSSSPFSYNLQFTKNLHAGYIPPTPPGALSSAAFVPSAPSAAFLMAQEVYIRRELEKLIADVTKSVEELQDAARACLNESFTSTKTAATRDGTEKATETAFTEEEEEEEEEERGEMAGGKKARGSECSAVGETRPAATTQHTRDSSARNEPPYRSESPASGKSIESRSEKSTDGLSESDDTLMIVMREGGDTSTSPDDSGEVVLAVEYGDDDYAEDLKFDGTDVRSVTSKPETKIEVISREVPKSDFPKVSTDREEPSKPLSQASSMRRLGNRSATGRRSAAGRRSSAWRRRRRRRILPRSPFGFRGAAGRFVVAATADGDKAAAATGTKGGGGEKRADSAEVKTSWSLLQQRWLSGAVTHILGLSRLWRSEHSAATAASNAAVGCSCSSSTLARRGARVPPVPATRAVACGRSVQSAHSDGDGSDDEKSDGRSEASSCRSVLKSRSPRRRHRKPSYSTSDGSTLTSLWLERVRRAGTTLGITSAAMAAEAAAAAKAKAKAKPKAALTAAAAATASDDSDDDDDEDGGGDRSSGAPVSASSGSSESTPLPRETPSLSPAPPLSSPQSGSGSLARTLASHSSSLLHAVVPATLRDAFMSSSNANDDPDADEQRAAQVDGEGDTTSAVQHQQPHFGGGLTSSCVCLPTSRSRTSSLTEADATTTHLASSKRLSMHALPVRRSLLEFSWNRSEADSDAVPRSLESSECSVLPPAAEVRSCKMEEEAPQATVRTTTASGPPNNKADPQRDSKLSDPSPNVSGHSTLRQSTVPFLVERLMADLQHCVRWSKAQRKRIALADVAKNRQLRRRDMKCSRAQARVKQAAALLSDAPLPTISEDAGRKRKSVGDVESLQTTLTHSPSAEFSTITDLPPCTDSSDHVLRQRILLNLKPRRRISSCGAKVRRHSCSPNRANARNVTPTTTEERDQASFGDCAPSPPPSRRGNTRDGGAFGYRKSSAKATERSLSPPRRKASRMRSPAVAPKELFSSQDHSASFPLQTDEKRGGGGGGRGGGRGEEKAMRGKSGSPLVERKFERDFSGKERYAARKRKGEEDAPWGSSGGLRRDHSLPRHSVGRFKSPTAARRVSPDSRDMLLAKRRSPKRPERSPRHSCSLHRDQTQGRECALNPEQRLSANKKKEPWTSTPLNCPEFDLDVTTCSHSYVQKATLSEDAPNDETRHFWENAESTHNLSFKDSLPHADAAQETKSSAGEEPEHEHSLAWASERFDDYLDFSPVTTPTFDLSINTWSERTKLFSAGGTKSPKGQHRTRTVAEALFKSVTSIARSARRKTETPPPPPPTTTTEEEKKSSGERARDASPMATAAAAVAACATAKGRSKRRKKGSPPQQRRCAAAAGQQVMATDRLSGRGVRRADALIDIRLQAPQGRRSESEVSPRDAVSASGTGDGTELDNMAEWMIPRRLAGGGSLASISISANGVLIHDASVGRRQPALVKPHHPPALPLFAHSRLTKARGQFSSRSTNQPPRSIQEAKKHTKMVLVKRPATGASAGAALGRAASPPLLPSSPQQQQRISPSTAVTNALQQALAAAAAAATSSTSPRRCQRCTSAASFASGITSTTTGRSEISGHLDAAAVDRAVEAAIKAALSSVFSAVQGEMAPDSALLRALSASRPSSPYAESTHSGVSDRPQTPQKAAASVAAVLDARRSAMIQTQLKIQAHTQTPLHSAISISSELCSSSAADLNAIGESNLKSLLFDCLRLYKLYADLDELDKALGCDTRNYITDGSEQCAIKGPSEHLLSNDSETPVCHNMTTSAPCTRNSAVSGIWNIDLTAKRPPLTAPGDLGKSAHQ